MKGTETLKRAILRSPDGENLNGVGLRESWKRFAASRFRPIFQAILLQRETEKWE